MIYGLYIFLNILLIRFLLKSSSMLSGGLSFWQQTSTYTLGNIVLHGLFILQIFGAMGFISSTIAFVVILTTTFGLSFLYFYGIRKLGGIFTTMVTYGGGLFLIIWFFFIETLLAILLRNGSSCS